MESTIAIVSLGGKQHLVSQGTRFVVNQLSNQIDSTLELPDLLSDRIVQAKVLSHQLGKKINGLKFKPKARYLKRYGHRQHETTVEIVSINTAGSKTKTDVVSQANDRTAVKAKKPITKKPITKKPVVTSPKSQKEKVVNESEYAFDLLPGVVK